MLQARERRKRLGLRERGHAPGADRGADQLDGPGVRQPFAKQQSIEWQEREPLRPAGCRGNAGDVLRREPDALDV